MFRLSELIDDRKSASPTGLYRHYFKCRDCLTVACADIPERFTVRGYLCGVCGGECEDMGKVGPSGRELTRTAIACPCDARCTGALGPKCNCKCGGVNHGTNRLVVVDRSTGPVPVIKSRATAKSLRFAAEWKAAQEVAREVLQPYRERKARGEFLGSDDFGRMLAISGALRHARKLKTHKGRIKALQDVGLPVVSADLLKPVGA